MFILLYGDNILDAELLQRVDKFFPISNHTGHLTSGQKQLVSLMVGIREAQEGSLILIDEPEISLHVDWQLELIDALKGPLSSSHIFVATHSPDIMLNHYDYSNALDSAAVIREG